MITLRALLQDEEGQDLVEYSLLIAFVMTVCVSLMIADGESIQGILFVTTTNLNAANAMAS